MRVLARLSAAQEKPRGLEVYLRTRLRRVRGDLVVEALRTQTSGNLSSISGHDALAVLPSARTRLARGDRVEVIVLAPPHAS